MRGKLALSAATAALLMFASAARAQEADQPGDATTQARFSETAEGEISPAGDVDWYRFSVEAGQRYSFTLTGGEVGNDTLDPTLAIYDAQGNQLAFNDDDGQTLNSALQYAPQESGEVFVAAGAFSDQATGPYHLAVTSAAIPPDDVGNDATTRARIRSGQSVTGNLEFEGDVDSYRLNARNGQTYHITLAGAGENGVGDTLLRVVDREGAELAVNDDADGLNSALDFVPSRSGDVFVEARGYADAYAGAYTLSVNSETGPRDNLSSERNTRGRLNVGQNTEGTLDFNGDRDWYRIRLQEGQSYRFTLNGSGESPVGDPLLRLYGADGEEIAMDDDGGEGLNSYLEYTAPATATYYIEARGFADEATGGYTIGVRAGDVPGDATTDASVSAEGDYRDGVLSPAGDHDWYRIDLTEGQGIRVALNSADGVADALGDPFLVLHGPDGAELLQDDDGGEGLNSWFEYQATAAGPHYIEVRGFTEDAAGRYMLSITAGEVGASAETAEPLQPNTDGRTSLIGANDDVDWFAIDLVEGRPYRFYLDGAGDNPLADPYLTLYDAEGHQVAADDDGGAGLNAFVSFTSVTGGTYYAAASSYESSGSGRYALRVVDTDVPGNMNTDENLDAQSDERASRIDLAGDLDNYRIELEGGVRYTIEVIRAGDDQLGDPFVAIVDGNGQTVTSDDDSGDGRNARVRFTPTEGGTYFIQASGLGGSTGTYQVRIMRQ